MKTEIAKSGRRSIQDTVASIARFATMDAFPEAGSALIAADMCRSILADTERLATPCGQEVGASMAAKAVAVFTVTSSQADGSDMSQASADLYMHVVKGILAEASSEVAGQAVADVVRNHRFGRFPKPGDFTKAVSDIMTPISNARAVARMHLREHERREAKRAQKVEEDARIEADREKVQAGFSALMGRVGEATRHD